MRKVEVNCKNCKESFLAREADRKRGWGKFCSKSCKAKNQTKQIPYNKHTKRGYNDSEHCVSEHYGHMMGSGIMGHGQN